MTIAHTTTPSTYAQPVPWMHQSPRVDASITRPNTTHPTTSPLGTRPPAHTPPTTPSYHTRQIFAPPDVLSPRGPNCLNPTPPPARAQVGPLAPPARSTRAASRCLPRRFPAHTRHFTSDLQGHATEAEATGARGGTCGVLAPRGPMRLSRDNVSQCCVSGGQVAPVEPLRISQGRCPLLMGAFPHVVGAWATESVCVGGRCGGCGTTGMLPTRARAWARVVAGVT